MSRERLLLLVTVVKAVLDFGSRLLDYLREKRRTKRGP